MTKTELRKKFLKLIFEKVSSKYNISQDFEDTEGHGYFTFSIIENDVEYFFDLSRSYYYVIGHRMKNDEGYKRSQELSLEIEFLHKRFLDIKEELDKRGIKNNMYDDSFQKLIGTIYYNNIEDDLHYGNKLVVERIEERITNMPRAPKYYGKEINRVQYINKLKEQYL